jgi:precorrin-2/cobalt-factor-2 C20-methyltransferase
MRGKLYGIGVGPGDSEQLTLKAKRILEEVDLIYAPISGPKKDSTALQIVGEVIDFTGRIERLHFPMTNDQEKLTQAWQQAGDKISQSLTGGREAAFITLGDPLLYSTYIYLLEELKAQHPEIEVTTLPGITSITNCSARLNLPLAKKEDKVAILPAGDKLDDLEEIVDKFETTVLLKVSRSFDKIVKLLVELGLEEEAVFISRCGQETEFITSDLKSLQQEEIDYLSLIIIRAVGA